MRRRTRPKLGPHRTAMTTWMTKTDLCAELSLTNAWRSPLNGIGSVKTQVISLGARHLLQLPALLGLGALRPTQLRLRIQRLCSRRCRSHSCRNRRCRSRRCRSKCRSRCRSSIYRSSRCHSSSLNSRCRRCHSSKFSRCPSSRFSNRRCHSSLSSRCRWVRWCSCRLPWRAHPWLPPEARAVWPAKATPPCPSCQFGSLIGGPGGQRLELVQCPWAPCRRMPRTASLSPMEHPHRAP
mmetsp:Transcript_22818/g.52841  ORF Transcript_22818/g.52841 Transcript_22818/m.52841 type:complete len:238 (-) Transcript_22818:655-1368(-)